MDYKIKYEFKKVSMPHEIAQRAENVMKIIGCRTMTSFISIGLTAYMDELESKIKLIDNSITNKK